MLEWVVISYSRGSSRPRYVPVPAGVDSASLGSLVVVSPPGSSAISLLSPSSRSVIPDCSSYSFFSSR